MEIQGLTHGAEMTAWDSGCSAGGSFQFRVTLCGYVIGKKSDLHRASTRGPLVKPTVLKNPGYATDLGVTICI